MVTARPADRPAASLVLRLFGPLEVWQNGRPLPRLYSRKGQWLLALLTLHAGRERPRDWLAGTLWPDCPQDRALSYLRRTLCDLRRALGPERDRLGSPTPHTLTLDLSRACRVI